MRSHTVSLVRKSRSARPGIGGTAGRRTRREDRLGEADRLAVEVEHALPDEPAVPGAHRHPSGFERLGRVDGRDLADRCVHVLHHAREVHPDAIDEHPEPLGAPGAGG